MEDTTTIHFLQESSPFCCFVSIQAHSWEASLGSYQSVRYGGKSQVKNGFLFKRKQKAASRPTPGPCASPFLLLAPGPRAANEASGRAKSLRKPEVSPNVSILPGRRRNRQGLLLLCCPLAPSFPGCLTTLFMREPAGLGAAEDAEAHFSGDENDLLLHMAKEQLPLSKPAGIRLTGLSGGFG